MFADVYKRGQGDPLILLVLNTTSYINVTMAIERNYLIISWGAAGQMLKGKKKDGNGSKTGVDNAESY